MTAPRPIVIIGVSQRSGTNFLSRLVAMHPDCCVPDEPMKEDFLLASAPLLLRYARRTARRWPRHWGDRAGGERNLVEGLGRGLLGALSPDGDRRRVVTKTPSTRHLDLAPLLLTEADLVLLVRDGRSVVESIHTGYRRSYAGACRAWRAGARDILDFQRHRAPGRPTAHLIRYEDLLTRREPALRSLFAHCGLDPDRYDFGAAGDLPVTGSSYARTGTGGIDWAPRPADDTFDPLDRSGRWPPAVRDRFDWLAGREQRALGYPPAGPGSRPVAAGLRNVALDLADPAVRLRDAAMRLRWRLRRAERRLRGER